MPNMCCLFMSSLAFGSTKLNKLKTGLNLLVWICKIINLFIPFKQTFLINSLAF